MKDNVLKLLIEEGPQKTLKNLQDYKEKNNQVINNLKGKNNEIDSLISMFSSKKQSSSTSSASKVNRRKNSILYKVEELFAGSKRIKKIDSVHNHLKRNGFKIDRKSVTKALSKLTIDGVLTREGIGKYKSNMTVSKPKSTKTGRSVHTGSHQTILNFLQGKTKPTSKADIQKHLNSKGIKTNARSAENALYILKKNGKVNNVSTGFYTIK